MENVTMENMIIGTETNITLDNFTALFTKAPALKGVDDDTKYQCDLTAFIIRVGVMVPMILFGFVGNTLSEMVMWPEINTSSTSFSLFMLAVVSDHY